MFIVRPEPRTYAVAEESGLALLSDLHLGAATVDMDAIKAELDEAKDNNDRILINGDIFDAILPSDKKRYKPESLAPQLRMSSNVLDDQLDMAEELLGPYADLIDMIGIGNHESAVEKYHSTDLVARIIRRLERRTSPKRRINYGGYCGFVDYRFRPAGRKARSDGRRLVIFYHHGSGGSSPVTKGMIDFNRLASWVDADVLWVGHKHNRIIDAGSIRLSCPQAGTEPKETSRICVMTGAYMRTYVGQSQESIRRPGQGRKGSYASDWGLAPQTMGGARLRVHWGRKSGFRRIRVEF